VTVAAVIDTTTAVRPDCGRGSYFSRIGKRATKSGEGARDLSQVEVREGASATKVSARHPAGAKTRCWSFCTST
jgi:hypothetical protein